MSNQDRSRNLLLDVMVLQVVFTLSVVLDIPIIRPITGFIYLTFVPGFLVMRILGLKKLDGTETLFFSVVVGIAVLMILGIIVNQISPLFGITEPLSLWPLMISLGVTVIASVFLINYFLGRSYEIPRLADVPKYGILLPIVPILSVVGVMLVNTQTTNLVYIIMLITVSLLIIWVAFSKETPTFHALTLLCVFLALMLGELLVTNYINGWDEWRELFTFTMTKDSSFWNLFQPVSLNLDYLKTNAMASVTVLPTIYSTLLNVDGTWIFKIVYPLLSSFMAIGLYHLFRSQTDEKSSFFGTFFYIVITVGLFGPLRQMIGQLFFISLLLLLFERRINGSIRNILFALLGFGLVVSHYSLSYVFLMMITILWLTETSLSSSARQIVNAEYVGLFAALTLMWYIYTEASGPLYGLLHPVSNVLASLVQDFLSLSSRGREVLIGIGLGGSASSLHSLGILLFQATELLILIGFLWVILKRKTTTIDRDYIYIMTISLGFLLLNIVIPNFSRTFRAERFYQVALITLAPLCPIGMKTFTDLVGKLTHYKFNMKKLQVSLFLVVLISLFLFRTELVYEVMGEQSSSLPLSLYRSDFHNYYGRTTNDQEVVGAQWLSKNINITNSIVFADKLLIDSVLYGYGKIPLDHEILITNWTILELYSSGDRFENYNKYVYLGTVNIQHNVVVGWLPNPLNFSETTNRFSTRQNKVFSNGGCQVLWITEELPSE